MEGELKGLNHPWSGLPAWPSVGQSFRGPELRSCKHPLHPAKFERIYQRDGMVYVQLQGLPWHVLGNEGENDLNKKIDRLRKAQRKGWYVQLVFPNGYDDSCRVMDNTVSVKKVKLKRSYNGDEVDAEGAE